MKLLFLLVLLTRNGAGDTNASFVNTENLVQCQQKELTVKGIFLTANIPILESQCIRNELRFSEFGHASTSSMVRHFYLIQFDNEVVRIDKMPDWRSCMQQQQQKEGQGRVYCSSSVQSLQN